MGATAWGLDPNSAHQFWSHWRFTVRELGRHVPYADVKANVARWLRQGFGSVGQARVTAQIGGYLIEARVEGPPAHDPAYVASVRQAFRRDFVAKGWGPLAHGDVTVRVLAGDEQAGRPATQLLVMPRVIESA